MNETIKKGTRRFAICKETNENVEQEWTGTEWLCLHDEKEKVSIHQQLMDSAYELCQKHKNWDKDDFFDHLDYIQKVAVALGNLNYQVENGGFSQWGFNGYAEIHYGFLSRLKVDATQYPKLTEALSLMDKAYPFLRKSFQFPDENENEEVEYYVNTLDRCDSEYYKLNDITDEMEKFIIELRKNICEHDMQKDGLLMEECSKCGYRRQYANLES